MYMDMYTRGVGAVGVAGSDQERSGAGQVAHADLVRWWTARAAFLIRSARCESGTRQERAHLVSRAGRPDQKTGSALIRRLLDACAGSDQERSGAGQVAHTGLIRWRTAPARVSDQVGTVRVRNTSGARTSGQPRRAP